MSANTSERVECLSEIQEELSNLVGEASELVRPTSSFNSAEVYWIAQMLGALGERGNEMCTMTDTINELNEE